MNLLGASDKQLLTISRDQGENLSLNEMKAIQKHFLKERIKPIDVELQTYGQT